MAGALASTVRFIGRVSGKYTLPGRPPKSGVSVYACRTQGLTPESVTVAAAVTGSVGAPVSANFDQIGLLHGEICRHVDGGFTMAVDPDRNDLEILARRIGWLKKRQTLSVPDNREHKRFIPRCSVSHIVLADGQTMKCFIVDMSASGVALSMDYQPPIGTPLAVGTVVGRVVRHLDIGFAVKFAEIQPIEELEARLVRKPENEGGKLRA